MAQKTITIRGKRYAEPSLNRLKRKQARQFQEYSRMIETNPAGVEFELIWDIVGLLIPKLPEEVLDDLDMGECQRILEDAGIMQFEGDQPGMSDEVGESSASSDS